NQVGTAADGGPRQSARSLIVRLGRCRVLALTDVPRSTGLAGFLFHVVFDPVDEFVDVFVIVDGLRLVRSPRWRLLVAVARLRLVTHADLLPQPYEQWAAAGFSR